MIGKLRIPLENGQYHNYYGEIRDGKAHGFGKSKNNKGESYIGYFTNNMRNGQGTWTNQIETYSGQWFNNQRHGQGDLSSEASGSYCGQWENGVKCGMGREYYVGGKYDNGGIYIGEWENGKWNGYGVWTGQDDGCYKGMWNNGELTEKEN